MDSTPRQRRLRQYDALWSSKYDRASGSDERAVFSTFQGPDRFCRMSNSSGVMPTYLTTDSRLCSPKEKRWVTVREKLNSMQFPVLPEVASAAGVPLFDHKKFGISHSDVGNSMHGGVTPVVSNSIRLDLFRGFLYVILPGSVRFLDPS